MASPPAAKLLGDTVYAELRAMILSSRFKPGQKLVDRELAHDLRVSRMPVLRALSRLERDGLVVKRARRGYLVVDLDAKQVADLYDLRIALEAFAIRLATERATPSDLDELHRILRTLDVYSRDPAQRGEEIRLGLRVHTGIAQATGNSFLYDTLLRLLERMWPFIWIEVLYEDPSAAEATRDEHRALVSLIADKRADEAEEILRRHLETAKEHIVKILRARENFYHAMPLPFMEEDGSR
jgi:DNA-binding GntR family transcriptional regulator